MDKPGALQSGKCESHKDPAAGSHSHAHDHSHHIPHSFGRAFAIGIVLNLGFVFLEAWFGWHVNSLALLADAAHNLGDVAGLALAWGGAWVARISANDRYTFGYQRASLWAAVANSLALLFSMGFLGWEASHRLLQSENHATQSGAVMAVAAVGILVNGFTAWLFTGGKEKDVNIDGAFWHMAGDAMVSAGVAISAGLSWSLGWGWTDPVLSILIAPFIAWNSIRVLRTSIHLLLDGVPHHLCLAEVRKYLMQLGGVSDVADLHVWGLGSTGVALTAHLVVPLGHPADQFFTDASRGLGTAFGITHVTLQATTHAIAGMGCGPKKTKN